MAATQVLGGRLLAEVESGNLEDLLRQLRKLQERETGIKRPRLGIPALDKLWARHGGKLEITGSGGLNLLYHIVSVAVSPPRFGAIVVIDADGRFDVTRLTCNFEDLEHVHVYRPLKGHVAETIGGVEDYLLGGQHSSIRRDFVGIAVNGAYGGDLMVGWRGWLRVESEKNDIARFGVGVSVEEAMSEREQRRLAVESKRWRAISDWGEYRWDEG